MKNPTKNPLPLALLALAFAVPAAEAARVVHKVSGPAVTGSDVELNNYRSPRVSPDGEWIVYVQDAEVNDALALWAVRRWGGVPKRISGTLPVGGEFNDVEFTPDSRRVLYTAHQETLGRYELYSVPLLGTAADVVKLSPPLPADATVYGVEITPDGTRAIFQTQRKTASGHSLFSAPVDGSAPATGLDGPYAGDGRSTSLQRVGNQLLFLRHQTWGGSATLWRVPIAGPATEKVRLSQEYAEGSGLDLDHSQLRAAPVGDRVAFLAREAEDAPWDLWVAEADGDTGSAIRVVAVAVEGGSVEKFQFTPDGERILFVGDLDVAGMRELFGVPADGSEPHEQLSTGLLAAGDVDDRFVISLDGTYATYVADWAVDEKFEAFVVPVEGPSSASQRVNRTLTAGEDVAAASAFGDMVFYSISWNGEPQREILGVPRDGEPADSYSITGVVESTFEPPFAITAFDSSGHLVYRGDPEVEGAFELWSVPLDGSSAPEPLESPFWSTVVYGDSGGTSPAGDEFFFVAAVGSEPFHLWQTAPDGSQMNPTRLTPPPVAGGGVDPETELEILPDGHGILFHADAETNGRYELFLADALVFKADFDEEGDLSEWTSPGP